MLESHIEPEQQHVSLLHRKAGEEVEVMLVCTSVLHGSESSL